jgi:hypothetical protein
MDYRLQSFDVAIMDFLSVNEELCYSIILGGSKEEQLILNDSYADACYKVMAIINELRAEFFNDPTAVEKIIILWLKMLEAQLDEYVEALMTLPKSSKIRDNERLFKFLYLALASYLENYNLKYKLSKQEEKEVLAIDKRRKYNLPSTVKAYAIYRVFGKYLDEYLKKPQQIELFNLITGDSGANIYNNRFGAEIVPTEKKELDIKIDNLLKNMK